jgi:hypothetical protein
MSNEGGNHSPQTMRLDKKRRSPIRQLAARRLLQHYRPIAVEHALISLRLPLEAKQTFLVLTAEART